MTVSRCERRTDLVGGGLGQSRRGAGEESITCGCDGLGNAISEGSDFLGVMCLPSSRLPRPSGRWPQGRRGKQQTRCC